MIPTSLASLRCKGVFIVSEYGVKTYKKSRFAIYKCRTPCYNGAVNKKGVKENEKDNRTGKGA